tara:strand:+ start:12770 stop:14098 length:1329 start_codon:yes stop_codon:yes gene_type:complete
MKPELLAPAGDWETLNCAIKAGADAIYFGIKFINMRSSSARNFEIKELKEVMQKLHEKKIKGYLTVNTVLYDHELEKVERILDEVKKAKVDAIIASDMSVVQMCNDKEIEVHISTQASVANYQAVKFFSKYSPRIVLARECTLDQIQEMKRKIDKENLNYKGRKIELETFVHGSLCVAYSGRCFMSQHHNRLSANRGQCLQECRKKYKITDIEDPRREFILGEDYILSPKDLCALPILDKLIQTGIAVFKIEGRAKGPEYIYNITKAYREAIDLIEKNQFTKKEAARLVGELDKVFNRGFSTNFLLGTPTNDSWTKFYGSSAKEKKSKIGEVTNYYVKDKVVSILIDQNELEEGDEVIFTGPTTGYYKTTAKEIRVNDKQVKKAKKGEEVTFKVEERIRTTDTLYKIEKRNIGKEEDNIIQQYEKIGIHKPFKFTKKDKGMT